MFNQREEIYLKCFSSITYFMEILLPIIHTLKKTFCVRIGKPGPASAIPAGASPIKSHKIVFKVSSSTGLNREFPRAFWTPSDYEIQIMYFANLYGVLCVCVYM